MLFLIPPETNQTYNISSNANPDNQQPIQITSRFPITPSLRTNQYISVCLFVCLLFFSVYLLLPWTQLNSLSCQPNMYLTQRLLVLQCVLPFIMHRGSRRFGEGEKGWGYVEMTRKRIRVLLKGEEDVLVPHLSQEPSLRALLAQALAAGDRGRIHCALLGRQGLEEGVRGLCGC